MTRSALSQVLWISAAAVLGFASAFSFSGVLALPRGWFLVPHVALAAAFLAAYARWSGTQLRRFCTRRWRSGAVVAVLVGALLTVNVMSQPASSRPEGLALWAELLWLGVVYGAADGLLLSALPIVATWRACARLGWTKQQSGRCSAAALGVLASAVVAAVYHLGYAEFRGQALGKAVLGNAIMSVAQAATGSPLAAVGSHVIMHVAAVLHGAETTVQLPPHHPAQ